VKNEWHLILINLMWATAVTFIGTSLSKCSPDDKPGVEAIQRLLDCQEQLIHHKQVGE
jgi:hypothetical protein